MSDMDKLAEVLVNGEPNKFDRVKRHIRENKSIYIGTAVGVAGFVGGALMSRRNIAVVMQYKPENSPVTLTQIVELVRRGHPGKVMLDTLTGEKYASVKRTAAATGMSPAAVRKLMGTRFEYLGDAQ